MKPRPGRAIVAQPNFWGKPSPQKAGQVDLYQCPVGHCCADAPCTSYDGCAGNRARVLRGDCAPGYNAAFGTTARVGKCGGGIAAAWVMVALAFTVLYAIYLYYSSGEQGGPGFG